MRTFLISLTILSSVLLSSGIFAATYTCKVLANEFGFKGNVALIENADKTYNIVINDQTFAEKISLEVSTEAEGIDLLYGYYAAANEGKKVVARSKIKMARGARGEHGDNEVSYLIFQDAQGKTLAQAVIIDGLGLSCK